MAILSFSLPCIAFFVDIIIIIYLFIIVIILMLLLLYIYLIICMFIYIFIYYLLFVFNYLFLLFIHLLSIKLVNSFNLCIYWFISGGGAVEMELSRRLREYSLTLSDKTQMIVAYENMFFS